MPNYRLSHKITGTTVPATAGYYGADSQSTTVWKRAGGGAYAWKSPTYADTYFMGATVDLTAYDTVTISGATDTAFNGAYVYSAAVSKWLKGTTHSIWKNTLWYLSDGVTTYSAADNGLSIPPASFQFFQGYSTDTATLSISSTAKFQSTSLSGTWAAINGGTGTPVYSEYTIGESWEAAEHTVFDSLKTFIATALNVNVGGWNMAEETIFDSLAAFLGNTEDVDCFRGYIPVNEDGKPKYANVWKITSGGSAAEFGIERTYGSAGNWCNELINAEIEGLFENRSTAMHFCGAVLNWLKDSHNVSQTGNVNWCHLRSLPESPVETIIGRERFWVVKVPLEILFLTEGVYT